ncbi:MAG: hypothetical protein ABIK93_09955, partial [candidate division WOR-3 bacterium]
MIFFISLCFEINRGCNERCFEEQKRTNNPRKEAAMLRNNNKTNPNRVESPTKNFFVLGRMSRSGSLLARIGLIILFAVSMVMAGGRKPKEVMVNASLRP